MNKPFYSVALLAAALLAGTSQADAQTVTKVKTKTSKSAKATAGNLTTPPPPPAEGEDPEGPVISIENELAAPLSEHLAQLTTAWYQADPLAPGTGLGLWIAGRLAHGLGLQLALREEQMRLVVTVEFPA